MNSPSKAPPGFPGFDEIAGAGLPRGRLSSTPMVAFKFHLFVAGDTPNSALALANLTALCLAHLPGGYAIETVDVFQEPQRALAEGVVCTPTLVRLAPGPMLRLVGTLSQTQTVLFALRLKAVEV